MDKNVKFVYEQRVKKVIDSLEKSNMHGYFVQNEEEAKIKIKELLNVGDTVSVGGSMTLFETSIIDLLRSGDYNFLDRYKDGITPEETQEIFRKVFSADVYIVSTNAITEQGELYNVDGLGNRVSAMMFGPKKVIVVVGINKIVRDIDEAIQRNKSLSGPANIIRLSKKTPCATTGQCIDCASPDRICNKYTVIKRENTKERTHVIFINKFLGY
ncbi:hypothetical protein DUF162 [Gottschalkia acidurici 9a]|uniref:LUD domain-containing protein n=1 Tax=Gottschalkia acidurici (strain ATCC 7906 / DSM 604 / BCRC 14475 / CIP 104303 / KCTC 5404 / NCIMB 10678 / 9a) TaxID=1128398 RepID=K0B1F7_GOTA9|nr:lactate utilization protein [Gottschalkia acidurici]AFS79329.1 hypothetical protein DUF162 [Gottschalkia acidurici 9a]